MIWKIYLEGHHQPEEELKIDKIELIFHSLGHVYFFNLTGGEPFLRDDLPEIVELGLKYLKPRIIHLPTNGIAAKRVIQLTKEILARINNSGLKPQVTVKPSIDGIGEMHDHIRGVPGNWKQLLATIDGLHELESEYPNFHLELGTVISNYHKNHLDQIEEFVHSLGVQSYRNEIAQQREELLNVGEPITPTGEEYAELMKGFSEKIRSTMYEKKPLARVTEALRLVLLRSGCNKLIGAVKEALSISDVLIHLMPLQKKTLSL
jgi:MoaA/NifB/PqqE/SkfB family radical SAM enzyme